MRTIIYPCRFNIKDLSFEIPTNYKKRHLKKAIEYNRQQEKCDNNNQKQRHAFKKINLTIIIIFICVKKTFVLSFKVKWAVSFKKSFVTFFV